MALVHEVSGALSLSTGLCRVSPTDCKVYMGFSLVVYLCILYTIKLKCDLSSDKSVFVCFKYGESPHMPVFLSSIRFLSLCAA